MRAVAYDVMVIAGLSTIVFDGIYYVLANWVEIPNLATFPNEDAITRLAGAIMLEQNDEWAVQRARYMTLETVAPLSEDPIFKLPAVAA